MELESQLEFGANVNVNVIDQSFNDRYSHNAHEALDELPHSFTITDPSIPGHPIVFTSRGFLKMSGYSKSEVIGKNGGIEQSFVLTNPHLPDMPIVYASDAFLKLTGYPRDEVLGHNCRFLSGIDTDRSTLCIKDKSSFWNLLHISPVRDASGKIAYFVGVQIKEQCKTQGTQGLSPELRQRSVVGAVNVAVRTLSMTAGSSKS